LNFCRLWWDDECVGKQLNGIGAGLAKALAKGGLTSFRSIAEALPEMIESLTKRRPPFGAKVCGRMRGAWIRP
jgi:predicted flap endonuclease-1-like 5' DNA nuclease